ncbi:MAG: efflux RND transporter periplasmic adaptor subunit [Bacteroidales bacterium]
MKKKKVLIILVSLVFILIILSVIGKKAGWIGSEHAFKVSAEHPALRDITEFVTANGKVQPETEVKISPEVSGEIIEITIEEGDKVKKGDLLLRINPRTYISAKERAEASLSSARAQYSNSIAMLEQTKAKFKSTERDYQRKEKLWKEGVISESEYEAVLSTYEMGQAELEAARQSVNSAQYSIASAKASLNEAEENLKKTRIYAPMNGVVSRLNVETGETVVGTMQMAGTELMRIADLNRMEVLVDVNENDIIKVSLFDTAKIEIDAYMGKEFKGMVTKIAHSASIEGASADQVTSFDVKIRLLKDSYSDLITGAKPYPFRPGLSATADIITEEKNNVMSVPIQAVTIRNTAIDSADRDMETLKEVVFKIEDNITKMSPVEIGIQDNQFIEVIKGVDTTDLIVTAPYGILSNMLKDGDKVSVVGKDELYNE